jgi:hypothetical protein
MQVLPVFSHWAAAGMTEPTTSPDNTAPNHTTPNHFIYAPSRRGPSMLMNETACVRGNPGKAKQIVRDETRAVWGLMESEPPRKGFFC